MDRPGKGDTHPFSAVASTYDAATCVYDMPEDAARHAYETARRPSVYDRAWRHFLQTDPIGYEDDLNLYAYVRNDPLNLSDPTGMQTRLRVQAYRIRGAAGALGAGHAFLRYDDTQSDSSRISRAGPGRDGDVLAQDDPTASSIDTLEPAGRDIEVYTLFDTTITNDFGDVQTALTDFGEAVNEADSEYRPGLPGQDPNSNSFATDALRAVIGVDIANTSPLTLPGFGEPLENVEQPEPLVDRDDDLP